MNPTTETYMWAHIRAGDDWAYQAMITGHYHMVEALARKLTNGGGEFQFQELLGEGMVSLCGSVSTYLEKKPKARFSTHATLEARRVMVKFLRTDGTVVKTEYSTRTHQDFKKKQNKLAHKLGQTPTSQQYVNYYGRTDPTHMLAITSVPLGDATEETYEQGLVFDELSESSRFLVESLSNGATLGQIATQTGLKRSFIRKQALEILDLV